jgi:hypothetical protein
MGEIVNMNGQTFEDEKKHLKEISDLPYGLSLTYLEFINEKGLTGDFFDWRARKLFQVI